MKKSDIVRSLREESDLYTPDVPVNTGAALSPYEAGSGREIALERGGGKKKIVLIVAAALAFLMFLAVLLPVVFGGGWNGLTTLVISINPSAEFTLENGKVKSAKALNQDAAVMLVDQDLIGMSAEDACVTFATLAQNKNLITENGIRIRVTGKDHARISGSVQTALQAFSVSDLPDEDYTSIMGGYNETDMKDFEDYLSTQYTSSREAFMQEVEELLLTYENDLGALDLGDLAEVEKFNKKYMLLGDDFWLEGKDLEKSKRECLEEYRELQEDLAEDPDEAFEDLFGDFLEIFKGDYEHGGSDWRHHDDDDDDDDDDDRWERDDDDDDDDDDD